MSAQTVSRGDAIRLVTAADALAHDLWSDGSNAEQLRRVDNLHHRLYDAWLAIAGGEHDRADALARSIVAELAPVVRSIIAQMDPAAAEVQA